MPEPKPLHRIIDQLEFEANTAWHEKLPLLPRVERAIEELRACANAPIPMRLTCPGAVPDGNGGMKICGQLHIDKGEFATKPHHTHSCQFCGMTWRPAVPHTVGVAFLPGFKDP